MYLNCIIIYSSIIINYIHQTRQFELPIGFENDDNIIFHLFHK